MKEPGPNNPTRLLRCTLLMLPILASGFSCSSDDKKDEAAAPSASWQQRILGNYGGPKIRLRSDTDVYVDMSYAGRPEAQVTSGSQRADHTVDITVRFPDAATFTGVFTRGLITWSNNTTWTQDRAWQDQLIGTYAGPRIVRQSDGDLAIDMSYASRPQAPVYSGYAQDDGSLLITVCFPDELTHQGTYRSGVITWDNRTTWRKDP